MTSFQQAIEARLTGPHAVSGRELARELHVDKDRIPAWRRGTEPAEHMLQRIAPLLGSSVAALRPQPLAVSTTPGAGPPVLATAAAGTPVVPVDVAAALKATAALTEIANDLDRVKAKVPDLIKALSDAEACVKRLGL